MRCVRIPGLLVFLHSKGVLPHPLQTSSCQRIFKTPILVARAISLGFFLTPSPLELGDPASLYLHRGVLEMPFYGLIPFRPTDVISKLLM